MNIRPYDDSDENAVVALWANVFAYDTPHNDPLASIQRKLAVGRELFFVAAQDGQVVGTVMGGYDGHRGWIYSLAVDTAYRRKGIGQKLMRHVEAALVDRGCPKINLQIHTYNAQAAAFYESIGYRVEERISMGKIVE